MGGRKENNVVTAFRKERHGALRGVERQVLRYDTDTPRSKYSLITPSQPPKFNKKFLDKE